MPTYNFYNKINKLKWSQEMTNTEREEFLLNNLNVEQVYWETFPALADPTRLGIRKPDSSFRDILKNAKKKYNGIQTRTTINDW